MRKRTGRPPRIAVAVAGLLAALGIAACGGDDEGIEGGETTADVPVAEAQGEPSGELTISNWPFYIDKQTVPDFEEETGISVKYVEDVSDNTDFFGKMQPLLEQGESGGRDLFIVTDWMAKKMYDLGYLQRLDKAAIAPAAEHLNPTLAHPSIDPNREYTLPWQGGMTGLVVNKVGRTTGWTQGKVTRTCVNTSVYGSTVLLYCQTFVSDPGGATVVRAGDSGSPVFQVTSGTSVKLLGILWGGSSDNKTFVFSPLASIQQELGTVTATK